MHCAFSVASVALYTFLKWVFDVRISSRYMPASVSRLRKNVLKYSEPFTAGHDAINSQAGLRRDDRHALLDTPSQCRRSRPFWLRKARWGRACKSGWRASVSRFGICIALCAFRCARARVFYSWTMYLAQLLNADRGWNWSFSNLVSCCASRLGMK